MGDYCTENEQIYGSETDECIDYDIKSRVCNENDHVMAAYNPSDGASKYYSGVIIQQSGDLDAFLIKFDDNALNEMYVKTEYVHKCSTVSFDYSSFNLLPHCIPHCQSIDDQKNKNEKKKRCCVVEIIVDCFVCSHYFLCHWLIFFVSRSTKISNDE